MLRLIRAFVVHIWQKQVFSRRGSFGHTNTWNYCTAKSLLYEPPHDKTNKIISAASEDSDQPGHQQ